MSSTPIENHPSSEESRLLALDAGDFAAASEGLVSDLYNGMSPSVLGIVRPNLIEGISQQLLHDAGTLPSFGPVLSSYKSNLFAQYLPVAERGDAAAISALPKLVSDLGSLTATLEITLENLDAVSEWRAGRKYLQYIGSFNPQHIGHRENIAAGLAVAGEDASAVVQVVANHPIKKDSLPPYEGRFRDGEQKLYSSTILDLTEVTLLDLPLSLGMAKQGTAQIDLLARIAGDTKGRWLLGGDKFLKDATDVRKGHALDKAGERFSKVHLYVRRRETEDPEAFTDAVDYVQDAFGAEVTVIPEPSDTIVLAAAASKIRALRAEGKDAEANAMEFPDLPGMR
ncbi:MAG TPA: hypothetical protein VLG16_02335 [Candidatus Saccharimonadales bacterium]|nr:hypothetical protein [Candidatus Saccharimonadales bacterium]